MSTKEPAPQILWIGKLLDGKAVVTSYGEQQDGKQIVYVSFESYHTDFVLQCLITPDEAGVDKLKKEIETYYTQGTRKQLESKLKAGEIVCH